MNGYSNCLLVKAIKPTFFACLLANYGNWSVICLQIQLYAYDFNICIWKGHNQYHTLLPSYDVCYLGKHFISLSLTSSLSFHVFIFYFCSLQVNISKCFSHLFFLLYVLFHFYVLTFVSLMLVTLSMILMGSLILTQIISSYNLSQGLDSQLLIWNILPMLFSYMISLNCPESNI